MKKIRFIISVAILILGIFLLSPNLTGHAIVNLSLEATSVIGMVFIMLGIIGLYSSFEEEHRKKEVIIQENW